MTEAKTQTVTEGKKKKKKVTEMLEDKQTVTEAERQTEWQKLKKIIRGIKMREERRRQTRARAREMQWGTDMAAVGLGFAGMLVQPLGRTPPASRPGPVLGAASPETTPTMRYTCAIPSHIDY